MIKIVEHPGVELARRIQEAGLNLTQFAHSIAVSPSRISELVGGKRSFTIDSAVRIAKAFETSPEFWLTRQVEYDLAMMQPEVSTPKRPSWMVV